jgi:hypothetical protein
VSEHDRSLGRPDRFAPPAGPQNLITIEPQQPKEVVIKNSNAKADASPAVPEVSQLAYGSRCVALFLQLPADEREARIQESDEQQEKIERLSSYRGLAQARANLE